MSVAGNCGNVKEFAEIFIFFCTLSPMGKGTTLRKINIRQLLLTVLDFKKFYENENLVGLSVAILNGDFSEQKNYFVCYTPLLHL
jgi:hypothetical protein